ncbi:MAG: biopolymer transporter ExbD, partial [Nitrospirae bacterium]|nr:biopolymer transporter ExbD [Nitrospirota bacterium]
MIEARRRRFMAEINVIPLVDVVLVLLVIFMVTAPMLYRGMDINLPRSSSNTIKPEERVVLTVERDRRVYVDKDLIPLVQLQQKMDALHRKNP